MIFVCGGAILLFFCGGVVGWVTRELTQPWRPSPLVQPLPPRPPETRDLERQLREQSMLAAAYRCMAQCGEQPGHPEEELARVKAVLAERDRRRVEDIRASTGR